MVKNVVPNLNIVKRNDRTVNQLVQFAVLVGRIIRQQKTCGFDSNRTRMQVINKVARTESDIGKLVALNQDVIGKQTQWPTGLVVSRNRFITQAFVNVVY